MLFLASRNQYGRAYKTDASAIQQTRGKAWVDNLDATATATTTACTPIGPSHLQRYISLPPPPVRGRVGFFVCTREYGKIYQQDASSRHTSKRQGLGIQARCNNNTNSNNESNFNCLVTLATVVSHLQLLWRGFAQGGVGSSFRSGLDPTCSDTRTIVPPMQKSPTVEPGSQGSPVVRIHYS